MGPAEMTTDLPLRPRFSWDIKHVPWTDGVGDQTLYAQAVVHWCAFHDNLDEGNSNRIAPRNRGVVLLAHLFGNASALCRTITDEVLNAEDGTSLVVNAVHKKDALSVVSDVYAQLQNLFRCVRRSNESFRLFEARFNAQLHRFNALGTNTTLSEAVSALFLLNNANVDNAQRISILAASAPTNAGLTPRSTTDEFIAAVQYEAVASVVRLCDLPTAKSTFQSPLAVNPQPHAMAAYQPRAERLRNQRARGNRRQTGPSRAQAQAAKNRSPCVRCGNFGHWYADHNADGSLRAGMLSRPAPIVDAGNPPVAPRRQPLAAVAPPAEAVPAEPAGDNGNALAFNMATVLPAADDGALPDAQTGPMVDNGAPYSAIGYSDLCSLSPSLGMDWSGQLEPIPTVFAKCPFWQYGTGEHHSEARSILGSVVLTAHALDGTPLLIRHLVLDGSSQWVVGRNVTSRADILQVNECCLRTTGPAGQVLRLPLIDRAHHLFLPLSLFESPRNLCALSAVATQDTLDWPALRRIVDRIHLHVCGHSSYSDMRTLLQRTQHWNDDVASYLARVVAQCGSCHATSRPKPSRKVSLASLHRNFNDVVCVDHFFLDGTRVFHAMDAATRYSAGLVCPDLSLSTAVNALETVWLSPFWNPRSVQGDGSFAHDEFVSYLNARDISFRPVPPRRHSKNVLESKHGVIRSVFLRLLDANPALNGALAAQQAISISNDLYGSHVLSAYELAKGFSRPISSAPMALPTDLFEAQSTLSAKRKLALILASKPIRDIPLTTGDLVDVYVRHEGQKRGKWSSPRSVLAINRDAWSITVPSSHGKTLNASIEDVRPSIGDDSLANLVRSANDELDSELATVLAADSAPADQDDIANTVPPLATPPPFDADYASDDTPVPRNPAAGDRVEIHWPYDNAYYPGTVSTTADGGRHVILYDDGDQETLDLSSEAWRFCLASLSSARSLPSLRSDTPAVLAEMLSYFGNKPFMLHQAEAFPPFATSNAYDKEEVSFKRTIRVVPLASIPANANVISSHTIYKVKIEDDHTLRLKARIAPHGNEDSHKHELRSDCSMCSPVGMRIILSIASLRKWRLSKLDVKSAFLQTGQAERDVYVLPPRESNDRGRCVWLLLTAAYGLINANAKWQVLSDSLLTDIGFRQMPVIPQLFVLIRDGSLVAIVAKIVDDLLLAGVPATTDPIIALIANKVELGTIAHGPGHLRYFGLNLNQADDYSTVVDGDDKLAGVAAMPISRLRRRELDAPLSSIEAKSFASLNSSIGWLGITASPFCAAFASIHQQMAPSARIRDFVSQSTDLRVVQSLGSSIAFPRPSGSRRHHLSITVFSDAGRSSTNGQLCYIAGLLLNDLKLGSVYHVLSWSSHKSKRPVRSIGAAEILAAGEAIDEGKILAQTMSVVLCARIPLHLVVDSKDLFTSLSTKRNSVDKSIRADVNCIRFEFERRNVARIIWVPGKLNLADPGTKSDSPLTTPLQLTLVDGRLAHGFDAAESCDADRPLG